MVERRSAGDKNGEPSLTNIDLRCDGADLTMAVFQENQSDHSSVKKRRADDQENTPQQYSDHKIEIPEENTSAPAHKHNDRSKVDDNQILIEKFPDRSERKGPGPGSRVLQPEAYCVSKTLNPNDVIPINPELHLSAYHTFILNKTLKVVQSLPGSYKKNLVVFDEADRKYNMILSSNIRGKYVRYSISADWEIFVKVHNLEAGDKILFYGTSNGNVSDDDDDCYYILKYVRKSSDNKDIDVQNSRKSSDAGRQVKDIIKKRALKLNDELKLDHRKSPFGVKHHRAVSLENIHDRKKINATGQGFSIHHWRVMTREAYCLSKTLTSIEVVKKNPKLYFDPYDASVLTDCPEIGRYPLGQYSKDLLVFDGKGRKYSMKLSHCISGGEIRSYCINTGWNRFLRKHNLKEGYELTFYRFRKTGVFKLKYYYVLKYFKKPPDKHNESTELKVGKIQQTNTILVSKINKESKARYNEVRMENTCDRKKRNYAQRPGSRDLTRAAYRLSKTLSTFKAVHQGNVRLYFDAYEASRLTGCPEILDDYHLGTVLKNLVVFDADDRRYDMVLSHLKSGDDDDGEIIYTLDDGWQRFVKTHNLRAGDEIFIYRIQDKSVHDECYYIIKYTRKPAGCVMPEMSGKETSDGEGTLD